MDPVPYPREGELGLVTLPMVRLACADNLEQRACGPTHKEWPL